MVGKTALNKEMKHLNGAYFRTIIVRLRISLLLYNYYFYPYIALFIKIINFFSFPP